VPGSLSWQTPSVQHGDEGQTPGRSSDERAIVVFLQNHHICRSSRRAALLGPFPTHLLSTTENPCLRLPGSSAHSIVFRAGTMIQKDPTHSCLYIAPFIIYVFALLPTSIGSTAVEKHATSGHPGNLPRLLSAAPKEGSCGGKNRDTLVQVFLRRVQLTVSYSLSSGGGAAT
jgi:hypothetical protein